MKVHPKSYFDFWDQSLKLYSHGLLARRAPARVPSGVAAGGGGPRGRITTFSRHSALRLRQALLCNRADYSSAAVPVGITLTLPWRLDFSFNQSVVEHDYRIAFDRFCKSLRRRFPASSGIFRHELQQRRAPHCHIVFYLSRFDFDLVARGRSSNLSVLRDIVFSFWLRAIDGSQISRGDRPSRFGYRYDVNISAFARRGVVVSPLNSSIAQYRYICDHASKHKKAQLGYHGKQWGFINRALLVPEDSVELCFSDPRQRVCFCRHVGRVIRFRVPDFASRKKHRRENSGQPLKLPSDVWRCRLSRPLAGRSVVFVSHRTTTAIMDALISRRIC